MNYSGYIFNLLWFENGHALVGSQYRKDVAHAVDLNEGTCECENYRIEKNPECKHLKFVRAVATEIRKRWP